MRSPGQLRQRAPRWAVSDILPPVLLLPQWPSAFLPCTTILIARLPEEWIPDRAGNKERRSTAQQQNSHNPVYIENPLRRIYPTRAYTHPNSDPVQAQSHSDTGPISYQKGNECGKKAETCSDFPHVSDIADALFHRVTHDEVVTPQTIYAPTPSIQASGADVGLSKHPHCGLDPQSSRRRVGGANNYSPAA